MSKSGRKFRDPFNSDARRRKAGVIEPGKRKRIEEIVQQELDDELQDMWYEDEKKFDKMMRESHKYLEHIDMIRREERD